MIFIMLLHFTSSKEVINQHFSLSLQRLITHSEGLQEIDLDDNLIGDLGGRELLEALMDRKEGNERRY